MYIKAVHAPRGTGDESRLFAVGATVNYGTLVLEKPPGEVCWTDELGIEGNALVHVNIHDDTPAGFHHHQPLPDIEAGDPPLDCATDHHPFWCYRWAWWWAEGVAPTHRVLDHSIEAIVTGGELYVMNDEGHTVERVR